MNLQHVRYFIALCDEKHITRAAKKCGVRQPSLTDAIQRLENQFGGRLFVRGSEIRLTALGERLHSYFIQIDEAFNQAQRYAEFQSSTLSAKSTVGPSAYERENFDSGKTN